jgi:hypothetical protein
MSRLERSSQFSMVNKVYLITGNQFMFKESSFDRLVIGG